MWYYISVSALRVISLGVNDSQTPEGRVEVHQSQLGLIHLGAAPDTWSTQYFLLVELQQGCPGSCCHPDVTCFPTDFSIYPHLERRE